MNLPYGVGSSIRKGSFIGGGSVNSGNTLVRLLKVNSVVNSESVKHHNLISVML